MDTSPFSKKNITFKNMWREWRCLKKNGENGHYFNTMERTDIIEKNGENGEKNGENGDF